MTAREKYGGAGRDRRRDPTAGGRRDTDKMEQAPRPGGRAAAQARSDGTAYQTQGSAALRPEPMMAAAARVLPGRLGPWLKAAPPLPVSVPRTPFILLVLFVVVGGTLGILMVNTKINENAFRIDKLQQEQAALNLQQQDLEQQIAAFESPGNLAAAARKLGLIPAGSPAFIRLPDGKLIGVPQPAGGSPSVASTDQQPTGQRPAGQGPAGQGPAGQGPAGQQPTGQQPVGQPGTGQQQPAGR
jgi:hypothetical protein